jgi:hypothetical protein
VVGVTFARRPRRSVVALAVVPAAGTTLALAGDGTAATLGVVGTVVLAAGVTVASRPAVSLGGLVLLGGVFAAGAAGVSPPVLVLGAAGVVVSWTTGQHVVGLATQLGREASVRGSVLAHLASATVATLSVGLAGFLAYRVSAGSVPGVAVAFLLVGIAALLVALRS